MSILVLGGAGYIGSHTVYELIRNNEDAVVIDNLETGHEKAIHPKAKFYLGDIKDKDFLNSVFAKEDISSVIHFAAYSLVGESMTNPLKYYENNLYGTMVLLQSMVKNNIKNIVFSSTCATYGKPKTLPISEKEENNPINPYGETKLSMEKMIKWTCSAHNMKYTALRYFNACGADLSGEIGEDHSPESHLIPLVLEVANNKRDFITIFGNDYKTPDGTCIRDYIHVLDLAQAHILAVKRLENGFDSDIFNLGTGKGFSVKEIIEHSRKVTGHKIPAKIGERRPGDPDELVAVPDKAINDLGWTPVYSDLDKIIETAWIWHKNHPNGFYIN